MIREEQPAAHSRQVRVAIAQSAPVYLDNQSSLAKALHLIQQAAIRHRFAQPRRGSRKMIGEMQS